MRAPKQKIRSFAYNEHNNDDNDNDDDDNVFDAPRHATRKQTGRGYQADGFVVTDDEDDGFAPVRVAKPLRRTKTKGLGAPITTDQRTAELTELQSDVLRDFMTGAKSLRNSIQVKNSHREAIFTDTVLREMGLGLPRNLDEMKAIPGIRSEMVDRYGKQFLRLINNTRDIYGEETPAPRNAQLRNRPAQHSRIVHEIDDADDDDEEVDDQNHRLVVDLCDDDDDKVEQEEPAADVEETGDESFYGDFDDDDDDDGEVYTSHHFNQAQNADVAEFNNRYTQLGGGAAPSTKAAAKAPAARGSRASGAGLKGKSSSRKRTSGNFGKNFNRVKKRGAKATGSGASTGAGRSRGGGRGGAGASGGGGGSSGWGSIMAMPT